MAKMAETSGKVPPVAGKCPVLTTEAKAANLGAIRRFIGTRMQDNGFPRKAISALTVSVTEHCENLISHAYAGKTGNVKVRLLLKYPLAKLTVVDNGPRFDLREQEIPDTSSRVKRGLGGKMGIKTIMALCDTVGYKRKRGSNENTFTVRVKKPGKGK